MILPERNLNSLERLSFKIIFKEKKFIEWCFIFCYHFRRIWYSYLEPTIQIDSQLFKEDRTLKILIKVKKFGCLRRPKFRMKLKEILEVSLILNVSHKVRNLIFYDFGKILSTKADIMGSEVLVIMTFLHDMAFFFDDSWIWRKKIKSKVRIVQSLIIFKIFINKVIAVDILIKSFTESEWFVHVVCKLSAIHKKSKCDVRFSFESILNNASNFFLCFVLAVLKENGGSVSVLIYDQVKLKLRVSLMQGIKFDKRSSWKGEG